MGKRKILAGIGTIALLGLALWLFLPPNVNSAATLPADADAIARGQYLVIAGGCISCHRGVEKESVETEGAGNGDAGNENALSGGLAFVTEFGTFYAPNITPDPATGIGNWTTADFLRAMQHGRTPSGSFYFPAFPYRAYAGLSEAEVLDIAAYLQSQQPVVNAVPAPETPWWLARWMVAGWNRLADLQPQPEAAFENDLIARGAHLARHLGHCGECHTPRNSLGIPDLSREFAGAEIGDEVIEPIDAEALVDWTVNSFDLFLLLGMKPDEEFAGGDMNEVIEHNTSKLTEQDRDALAAFFTRHQRQSGSP